MLPHTETVVNVEERLREAVLVRKGRTSPSEQKAKRTGTEKSPRLEAKGSTATGGSQATETEEELKAQQCRKQG